MHQLPLTPKNKQKTWTAILHIAKTNGFPLSLLTKPNTKPNTENTTQKISVIFTIHSPVFRKLTNFFRNTNLKIVFRFMNTIHNILHTRTNNTITKN